METMLSSQPVFKRTELEGFDVLLEKAEAISGCPFSQHLKEESLISLFPFPSSWEQCSAGCAAASYPLSFSSSSERWSRQNTQIWAEDSCLWRVRYWRLNPGHGVCQSHTRPLRCRPSPQTRVSTKTNVSIIFCLKLRKSLLNKLLMETQKTNYSIAVIPADLSVICCKNPFVQICKQLQTENSVITKRF